MTSAVFAIALCFLVAFSSFWRKPDRRKAAIIGGVSTIVALALYSLFIMDRYELVKTVGRLLMPAGILWVGLYLWGISELAFGRRRVAVLALTFFVMFAAAGSPLLGGAMVASLESEYRGSDPYDGEFDAVLVLGGGTTTVNGRPALAGGGGRVTMGARMYNRNQTPLLIASGSTPPEFEHQHDSADTTRAIWVEMGVDRADIITWSEPHDTTEEIERLAEEIDQHGWERVGVISSARHLPRAMATADRVGVDVVPIAADFRGGVAFQGVYSLVPGGDGFALSHTAFWEFLGRVAGQ